MKLASEMTNQELFEVLRMLVVLHGDKQDVDVLHEFKDRYNSMFSEARWDPKLGGGLVL